MLSNKTNNKGYSLMELIIVLAIILLVSGASLISINVLFSARVKSDSQSFNSEIGLLKENRYVVQKDLSGNPYTGYYNALHLYKHTDGRFYIQKCVYKPSDGTTVATDTRNAGLGLRLTSYTTVTYVAAGSGTESAIDSTGVNIVFNRDGYVHATASGSGVSYTGAGTFIFKKRNGDTVARAYVRRNGSHNVR